jgi:hypothetical protein
MSTLRFRILLSFGRNSSRDGTAKALNGPAEILVYVPYRFLPGTIPTTCPSLRPPAGCEGRTLAFHQAILCSRLIDFCPKVFVLRLRHSVGDNPSWFGRPGVWQRRSPRSQSFNRSSRRSLPSLSLPSYESKFRAGKAFYPCTLLRNATARRPRSDLACAARLRCFSIRGPLEAP